VFPPGTKSLLSKFLTREVFDELKDKVTSGGISLRVRCCSGDEYAVNTLSCVPIHVCVFVFRMRSGQAWTTLTVASACMRVMRRCTRYSRRCWTV